MDDLKWCQDVDEIMIFSSLGVHGTKAESSGSLRAAEWKQLFPVTQTPVRTTPTHPSIVQELLNAWKE
jgi:hypothetical protein